MKQKTFKNIVFALALSMLPMTALQAMNEQQPTNTERSVSLLYYPSITCRGGTGHVKLEINGMAYNRTGIFPAPFPAPELHDRPLKTLIHKATHVGGKPFFRFVFDVDTIDTTTIPRLLDYIKIKPSFYDGTCSYGAASPLRKTGICSIPAPLSIFPLTTASYLVMSNKFGLEDKIKKIEYYGDPSPLKNLHIVPGVLVELAASIISVAMIGAGFYLLNNLNS